MRVSGPHRCSSTPTPPCAVVFPLAAFVVLTVAASCVVAAPAVSDDLSLAAGNAAATMLDIQSKVFKVSVGLATLSIMAIGATAMILGRWPAAWFNSVCGALILLSFLSTLVGSVLNVDGTATDFVIREASASGAVPWSGSFVPSSNLHGQSWDEDEYIPPSEAQRRRAVAAATARWMGFWADGPNWSPEHQGQGADAHALVRRAYLNPARYSLELFSDLDDVDHRGLNPSPGYITVILYDEISGNEIARVNIEQVQLSQVDPGSHEGGVPPAHTDRTTT